MAIDWSGYQIPGYMAAQQAQSTGSDVGSALALMMQKGLARTEVGTEDMAEGIRGKGRSYYRDKVDKSIYGSYEEWVQSNESGRMLRLAEAGVPFRMSPEGELQLKSGEGKWITQGGTAGGEADRWDPYYQQKDLTQFESSMQKTMMGDDWFGGEYSYKAPMSALGALFSPRRYRPQSYGGGKGAARGYYEGLNDPSRAKPWMSYFNAPPGGKKGGRGILLDWMQKSIMDKIGGPGAPPIDDSIIDDPLIDDPPADTVNKQNINVFTGQPMGSPVRQGNIRSTWQKYWDR